jgi:hypothetical protein
VSVSAPGPTTVPRYDPATDFSLVLGGPLYQLFRRTHLQGPWFEFLGRRLLCIVSLTWVPIVALAATSGSLFDGPLPFARDVESQIRFLVVLPLLIIAEWVVHDRLLPIVQLFQARGIIRTEDLPRFRAAITSAMKVRNSAALELALLVFTFTLGHMLWQRNMTVGGATWYAVPENEGLHLTAAGNWFAFVSIPISQFLILRWFLRLGIWSRFLWQVSRLDPNLLATHADRAGGLGFLGTTTYAFAPVLFAEGALVAGIAANRILYRGETIASLEASAIALLALFSLAILGPLTFFGPQMVRVKRLSGYAYGSLATIYSADFDQKWIGGGSKGESILGSSDIQSLADLANSVAVVREMRLVPFGIRDVLVLVIAITVPLVPVVLMEVPLQQVLSRLLQVII